MQATGTWVLLKDPTPKQESSPIILTEDQRKRLREEQDFRKNLFEIHSVGPEVRDKNLHQAFSVAIDPRPQGLMVTIGEEELIVVQENQIICIVEWKEV